MTRVADYIAEFLSDRLGLKDVFMLTGAGSMHLTDGVACNPKLRPICLHHEQSVAMALEAYSRTNENFGAGYFTTGPGSTNALTGLVGAWQDTVPCLFISGNVKRAECSHTAGVPNLRQFGIQEIDIIPIVSSVSKYAVQLTDPLRVRYELEKCVHIAKSGRPGPVWLDVPLDVQSKHIDLEELEAFDPGPCDVAAATAEEVTFVRDLLMKAERPVIIAGRGVRLAGARDLLHRLAVDRRVPVVTPYLGIDNMNHGLDAYIGKIGIKGDRPANFAAQNSDLVLAIGTSLHVSVVGYDYHHFARAATKVVVDIDKTAHLRKTIAIDRLIQSDAKIFLSDLIDALDQAGFAGAPDAWMNRCTGWKRKYLVAPSENQDIDGAINVYSFLDLLSKLSGDGDVFVTCTGTALFAGSQGLQLTKEGQRYIPSSAMATMGYALPAAIGVSAACGDGRVIALTGDGSLQQNIQELQSLLHYKLPVKLFVLNNDGYLSIRTVQRNYFNNRLIGEGPDSGVSMPDTVKVCGAYGVPAERVSAYDKLEDVLRRALAHPGPYVVDIICPPNQPISPAVSSKVNPDGSMQSRPLEDMAPFLDREEYLSNLLIDEV